MERKLPEIEIEEKIIGKERLNRIVTNHMVVTSDL